MTTSPYLQPLIDLVHAYGFRKESPTLYVRRDGAAVMLGAAGDFAYRKPDGTFATCRAQAMCSYYRMYPIPYAMDIFTREFAKLDPSERKAPTAIKEQQR